MSILTAKFTRGVQSRPVRLVVYGHGGVGKSTFAAGAPSPLFFDFEHRTGHLDVTRVEPNDWAEVLAMLRELHADPGEFRTVVFDTLDHMELLIHAAVCKSNAWANIEEPGFGKGFVPVLAEWSRFLAGVEALGRKGIGTVMLAHPMNRTVLNSTGENYDTVDLKLRGGPKTNAADLIKEKVDLVGFAHYEDFVKRDPKASRPVAKAITTGERKLSFGYHPGRYSKRGIALAADDIPLTWTAFTQALEQKP